MSAWPPQKAERGGRRLKIPTEPPANKRTCPVCVSLKSSCLELKQPRNNGQPEVQGWTPYTFTLIPNEKDPQHCTGQGNTWARLTFGNHQVVVADPSLGSPGRIYDPSYGKIYANAKDWQDTCVQFINYQKGAEPKELPNQRKTDDIEAKPMGEVPYVP